MNKQTIDLVTDILSGKVSPVDLAAAGKSASQGEAFSAAVSAASGLQAMGAMISKTLGKAAPPLFALSIADNVFSIARDLDQFERLPSETGGKLSNETALSALSTMAAGVALLPAAPSEATPASNYRQLRDTDNRYWINSTQWIDFAPNQVKVNNSNRSYLIGTDGNDNFDATYYAAYSQWINSGLLVNFLAGGGNDVMGGSSRADNLWGGTGGDTLLGYAGDRSAANAYHLRQAA